MASDPFAAFGVVRNTAAPAPAPAPAAPMPMNQMASAPPPYAGNYAGAPPTGGGMGMGMQQPGMNGAPMGMQPGMQQPMGMQQQPMGMQQQPMGMQQQPMGMQQQPMGMQQQPMGMAQPGFPAQQAPPPQAMGGMSLEESLGLAPAQPAAAAPPPAPPANDPFANPFAPQQPAAPPTVPDVSDPFSNPMPTAAAPPAAPVFDASDPFSNPAAPPAPPPTAPAESVDDDDDDEAEAPAGEAPSEVAISPDADTPTAKAPTVLSRQDTFKYLEELANGNTQTKVDAARALKSLAFNANAEYKEGLLKGGVPRLLMVMISDNASTASLEQATSCMYSMAREHMESKQSLVKAGAMRVLATTLIRHESKQCQLNSCATLYAISCAGREVCKTLATFKPLDRLRTLVNPGTQRTPQDDQLQLFAALLIVNLLHVKGITSKDERAALATSLQRAYDDATETQVRQTIEVGLKRLSSMGSRRSRMASAMGALSLGRKRGDSKAPKGINPSQRISSGGGDGGGAAQGGSGMQGFGSSPPAAAPKSSKLPSLGFGKKKTGYTGSDSPSWNE